MIVKDLTKLEFRAGRKKVSPRGAAVGGGALNPEGRLGEQFVIMLRMPYMVIKPSDSDIYSIEGQGLPDFNYRRLNLNAIV